ncbi:MAG: DegT/DnrJ/EryC1/StrS family aminotransferase [Caldilineaceae bacterium]|nr:DegT/DnrJ/EryC1/StrS family aminotransferase [Caldilineaceae bacterium]
MPGPGMELIGEEEIKEVLEVLRSGYLYRYDVAPAGVHNPHFQGKVRKFEERIAAQSGVPYALAVNSGTSALFIALAALGIGPGDEVIVPGFTFVASISSIVYAHAVPVLAEIDETFNLDPADVRRRITPRTKAIMVVHMMGNPARLDELKAIADEHGLYLIEDCAQAFGASYKGKAIGTVGDIGTFSFNVYKTITAGDGGMLIMKDEALYKRCFAFHDQGHLPLRSGVEVGQRPFLGLDFRFTEIQAAVLLAQLAKMSKLVAHLRRNKALFHESIADLPGLQFRFLPDPAGDIATMLTVIFPTAAIARKVAAELNNKVIAEAGWHVYNNMEHLLEQRLVNPNWCSFTCPHYADRGGAMKYTKGMLPQTDDLLARAMNISIGVADPGLGSAFGVTINDDVEIVLERAAEFRAAALRYLG